MYRGCLAALIVLGWCNSARPASPAAAPELLPQPREFNDSLVISSLIEALSDTDSEVRAYLGTALAGYGTKAVPALLKALTNENRERRAGAAYAFAQMRPPPPDALPALLQAVKDPEETVRRQAAYAVSRITRSQPAAPIATTDTPVPPPEPTPGGRR